ncbi:MAG: hypothetical protein JO250_21155 [Armatimonadetes bacterium]|nr:hypothetical protein [Armatimonadota bacterium]
MQHASDQWHVAILVVLLSLIIVVRILLGRHGAAPFIRRIAGLNAIDEAVGRATEMGRPVVMVPGISGLDIVTLQALSIFSYVARNVARFGNRTIVPTIDGLTTGVAQETLRDAYADSGRPDLFHEDDVRYLTDQQFPFALGVAGLLTRERAAASFLFGTFAAEALIMAEVGQEVGAVQIAGTPSTTQIPFFIAACDYVIIGDEYYAATAYISRDRTLLGSIVGQDYCKLILLAVALLGCVAFTWYQWLTQHHHAGPLIEHLKYIVNYFKPG